MCVHASVLTCVVCTRVLVLAHTPAPGRPRTAGPKWDSGGEAVAPPLPRTPHACSQTRAPACREEAAEDTGREAAKVTRRHTCHVALRRGPRTGRRYGPQAWLTDVTVAASSRASVGLHQVQRVTSMAGLTSEGGKTVATGGTTYLTVTVLST